MKLFQSSGILHYGENKLIVEVDRELAKYYFALVPKSINLQPQRYAPHISVVRKETPPNKQYWDKYEGEIIEFLYEPYVYNDEVYYWLNTFCNRLERIRLELGLPISSQYTRPPSGFDKCFHITIGNTKSNFLQDISGH